MDQATHSRHGSVEDQIESTQGHRVKKLIVCCDGTWMDSDNGWVKGAWGKSGRLQHPSNVTRISRAVAPEDDRGNPQIVYYQAGIGTGIGLYEHLVGGGTGMGLSEHIREAYSFLAANYNPGDKTTDPDSIFLLGFSRGAFTARSLGGFIGAMGILTKKAMPYFYECFMDWENAGNPKYQPKFFEAYVNGYPEKKIKLDDISPDLDLAHARDTGGIYRYLLAYRMRLHALGVTNDATINAIGVWDTVGALGIPVNTVLQDLFHLPSFIKEYRWYDTRLDDRVDNAFQALALDECRSPYSPAVWQVKDGDRTNLKQVWFPGAHSNVGGSYADYGMANITLAWMMDQMCGRGAKDFKDAQWIRFDDDFIDVCVQHSTNYYNSKTYHEPYRGWAMGKVYNSFTFPQSLAGARTRTPGLYHTTDYNTGRYTNEVLRNTHEYIHSSVRARVDRGGRAVEWDGYYQWLISRLWRLITLQTDKNTYKPHRRGNWFSPPGPLHWWRLLDGHETHTEPNHDIISQPAGVRRVQWEYVRRVGKGKPSPIPMPEDIMAEDGYERMLLEHDGEMAEEIEMSGSGWRWLKKLTEYHHIARTF